MRKTPGRRKKPQKLKRKQRLPVYLTTEELVTIHRAATEAGKDSSEWVRQLALEAADEALG